MPVNCSKCGEWIELNSTRESPLNKQLMCSDCFFTEDKVNDLIEEAKEIHYGLENHEEYMKGDRHGWRRNLKEIKYEISTLGYSFDDFVSYLR